MQLSIDARPTKLSDVFGQPSVVRELYTRIQTNELPKAFLLKGPSGVGKSTVSKILAMSLVCDHMDKEGNPCGKCAHCKDIIHENYAMDVSVLDGGSDSGKAAVVEFGKMSQMSPMYSKSSVYIIEEADQLSSSAKTSLFKVLEKPTENVYFILLSMEANGIPKAIADRCQKYKFNSFNQRDIMFALRGVLKSINMWGHDSIPSSFFSEGIRMIAESSDGSLREAVQLLDKCIFGKFYTVAEISENLNLLNPKRIEEFLLSAVNGDSSFFTLLEDIDLSESFNLLYSNLSDALQYKITRTAKNDYFEEETKRLSSGKYLVEVVKVFEHVLSTPIYMKKQFLASQMAQLFLKP